MWNDAGHVQSAAPATKTVGQASWPFGRGVHRLLPAIQSMFVGISITVGPEHKAIIDMEAWHSPRTFSISSTGNKRGTFLCTACLRTIQTRKILLHRCSEIICLATSSPLIAVLGACRYIGISVLDHHSSGPLGRISRLLPLSSARLLEAYVVRTPRTGTLVVWATWAVFFLGVFVLN